MPVSCVDIATKTSRKVEVVFDKHIHGPLGGEVSVT